MPRSFRRLVLGTIGIALLAACEDSPTGQTPDERRPDEAPTTPSGDVLATHRLGVDLRVSGAMRPGAPVVITTSARARHDASDVEYDLLVLDDDGTVDARERGLGRAVGNFRGRLGRGAQRQLTATVTFSQPGYYRVAAVARNNPAGTDPQQVADSAIVELAAGTLYLLIQEQGGRASDEYDPTAVGTRTPLYGSFGPFVQGRTGGGAASAGSRQNTAMAVGGRHVLRYENLEAPRNPDGSVFLSPVPNAEIVAQCLDASFYNSGSPFTVRSAADGSFTITCPSGYYDAVAHLRSTISHVVNRDSTSAAVLKFHDFSYTDLKANNSHAAHVHRLLNRYVPLAQQRFGMSRTQVRVVVNNVLTDTIGSEYSTVQDEIRQNHTAVFGEYGRFVTVHEYGHSYHYKAIEPWTVNPNYCNGSPTHSINGVYDHNCAFVEGFADFFGSWIAADSLVSGLYSDYQLETHRWYSGVDGSKVEGAFAGFLYDLVDGPGDPDNSTNTGPVEDVAISDGVSYPASFLASTMRLCTLTDASGTYSRLYGTYDMVYCLENSLTPYSVAAGFGYTWRRYSTVSRNVTAPAGYDVNAVRRLWRANFFGA